MRDWLLAYVDAKGRKRVVIVHSFGGVPALQMASEKPGAPGPS